MPGVLHRVTHGRHLRLPQLSAPPHLLPLRTHDLTDLTFAAQPGSPALADAVLRQVDSAFNVQEPQLRSPAICRKRVAIRGAAWLSITRARWASSFSVPPLQPGLKIFLHEGWRS